MFLMDPTITIWLGTTTLMDAQSKRCSWNIVAQEVLIQLWLEKLPRDNFKSTQEVATQLAESAILDRCQQMQDRSLSVYPTLLKVTTGYLNVTYLSTHLIPLIYKALLNL